MGLDMYLSKRTYVKNWSFQKDEEKFNIRVKKGNDTFEKIKPEYTSWYRGSHIAILSSSDVNRVCKPQPNLCTEH